MPTTKLVVTSNANIPAAVRRRVESLLTSWRSPSFEDSKHFHLCKSYVEAQRSRSFFRGVSSSGNDGKWQARILLAEKFTTLDDTKREEDAALAYDEAAMMCHGVAAITNFGRPGIHINAVHTRPGYITGTIQHAAITMLLQEALAFQGSFPTHSVGSSNGFEKKFTAEKHKIQGHHISAVLEHSRAHYFPELLDQ